MSAGTEPYRPSNGTEGDIFYEDWCAKCDREGDKKRCRIFTLTLAHQEDEPEYPKEWICDADAPWPGNPRCTAFVARGTAAHKAWKTRRRQMATSDMFMPAVGGAEG